MNTAFFATLSHTNRPKGWSVGIIVFFITAILSANVIWHLDGMRVNTAKHKIEELAQTNVFHLKKNIDQIMALSYPIAAMIREDGSIDNFDYIAEKLISHYPLISEIALVPGGIIRHVVPLEENKKAVGFDLFSDPQ
jgi:sensor domain CHASE-containing protein